MIRHIVFWGLCATLIFVPIPFGSVEPWAESVFVAATLALFVLHMGGELMRRGKGTVRKRQAPVLPKLFRVLIIVFVVVSVIQILPLPPFVVKILSPRAFEIYQGLAGEGLGGWQDKTWYTLSLAPHASASRFIMILGYGMFGFLALRSVRTRPKMEIFVLVMIASGLFQAFYGLAEHFSGTERILGFEKTAGVGSATGTYVNRNHYAGFLEMIFPLSLGYLLAKARYFLMEKGMSLRRRILWFSQERLQWTMLLGLASVFLGTGLVFSKSRSGVLIFLVTMMLAAVAVSGWRAFADDEEETGAGVGDGDDAGVRDEKKRLGRILRGVFAVVMAAALWLGVDPIIKRFMQLDITRSERRTFIRNTVEMIGDYPLAGVGKGTYVHSYAMYEKVDDWKKLSYAHNDYLQILAENGIIGGGALVVLGIGVLVVLFGRWRRRRDNFGKAVGLGAMLAVTAILIHGVTDFNLQIPANAVYFVAIAALGLNAVSLGRGGARSADPSGGGRGSRSGRGGSGGRGEEIEDFGGGRGRRNMQGAAGQHQERDELPHDGHSGGRHGYGYEG